LNTFFLVDYILSTLNVIVADEWHILIQSNRFINTEFYCFTNVSLSTGAEDAGMQGKVGTILASAEYLLSKNIAVFCPVWACEVIVYVWPCASVGTLYWQLSMIYCLNDCSYAGLIAFVLPSFLSANYLTFHNSVKNCFNCNYPMHFWEKYLKRYLKY